MEKNKSREQSTRSDVVRQLKAVRKEQHITQEVLDFLVKVAGCLGKTVEIQIMDK